MNKNVSEYTKRKGYWPAVFIKHQRYFVLTGYSLTQCLRFCHGVFYILGRNDNISLWVWKENVHRLAKTKAGKIAKLHHSLMETVLQSVWKSLMSLSCLIWLVPYVETSLSKFRMQSNICHCLKLSRDCCHIVFDQTELIDSGCCVCIHFRLGCLHCLLHLVCMWWCGHGCFLSKEC